MKEYTPQNPVFSDKFNLVERADDVNAQIHNASVKQVMDNTVVLKKQLDSCIGSMEGDKPQFVDGIKSDNVVGAVNEVFLSGSEKKAQLAENLTAMGVQASASDTWEVLLDKVLDMTDTSGDTVTAPVLLTGYTAHDAAREQITGEMPELADVTVNATTTTQDSEYTYLGLPEGHYSEDSKVRTKNSNISKTLQVTIWKVPNWPAGVDHIYDTMLLYARVQIKDTSTGEILCDFSTVNDGVGYGRDASRTITI